MKIEDITLDELKRLSTKLLIIAIVQIFAAIVVMTSPIISTLAVNYVIAGAFLVSGVLNLWKGFMNSTTFKNFLIHAIVGLIYIWLAYYMMLEPFNAILSLTAILGMVYIVKGLVMLLGTTVKSTRLAMIITGAINVLVGALIFFNLPTSGLALPIYIAISLATYGIMMLYSRKEIMQEISRRNDDKTPKESKNTATEQEEVQTDEQEQMPTTEQEEIPTKEEEQLEEIVDNQED